MKGQHGEGYQPHEYTKLNKSSSSNWPRSKYDIMTFFCVNESVRSTHHMISVHSSLTLTEDSPLMVHRWVYNPPLSYIKYLHCSYRKECFEDITIRSSTAKIAYQSFHRHKAQQFLSLKEYSNYHYLWEVIHPAASGRHKNSYA